MKRVLLWAARIGIAALFTHSAWTKLVDPEAFAQATANYRMLPDALVTATALFLPWLELWCAMALLAVSPFRRAAWGLITAMMVVFTVAKVSALARGLDIACGCTASDDPMTWLDVGENLLILVPCVYGLATDFRWSGVARATT